MKKVYLILAGILGIHLLILARLGFTAWPEMVSFPYLVSKGFALYKDFVHPYPPLLTFLLVGVYKLFGYKLLVLKVLTWAIVLANDVLIFLIVKKLAKSIKWALIGVLFYSLTQPFLEGNQLWFDLAIVPPLLLGTLFFLNKKYLLGGLLIAVAALTKQTAGIYLVLGFLYLVFTKEKFKNILFFSAGPIVLGVLLGTYLVINNLLLDFLDWTLVYPFTFWSSFPGYVQMELNNRQVLILGVLLIPLIFLISKVKNYALVVLFFATAFILVYPRFSFFHFQLALAFFAILYGIALKEVRKPIYYVLFLIPLIVVFLKAPYNFNKEARFWSSSELEFAHKIRLKAENKSIFLLGSQSALYVFSESLPPKPWADNFVWFYEIPGFQEKVIKSWDENRPSSIAWQDPSQGNWFDLGVYQPKKITDWISINYNRKEEIEPGIWLWQKK